MSSKTNIASGNVPAEFSIDTTFVLFFLGIEVGQSIFVPDIGTLLASVTFAMVLALPYFLPSAGEKPELVQWLCGRGIIGTFAIAIGAVFHNVQGSVLPEYLRSLPLTLLILSAMISCYIQFYSLLKLRLAK